MYDNYWQRIDPATIGLNTFSKNGWQHILIVTEWSTDGLHGGFPGDSVGVHTQHWFCHRPNIVECICVGRSGSTGLSVVVRTKLNSMRAVDTLSVKKIGSSGSGWVSALWKMYNQLGRNWKFPIQKAINRIKVLRARARAHTHTHHWQTHTRNVTSRTYTDWH